MYYLDLTPTKVRLIEMLKRRNIFASRILVYWKLDEVEEALDAL